MAEFECKGTRECRDICQLLSKQGIEAAASEGECHIPSLYREHEGSVFVELDKEPQNQELTAYALASLRNILKRHDNEPHNLDHLVEIQYEVLNAHQALWQAMIEATKENRRFTAVEREFYEGKIAEAEKRQYDVFTELSHETRVQARAAFDSQTLAKYDIVFDEQALRIINTDICNYHDGRHTLVVGDMGISKTNLVLFTSSMANGEHGQIIIAGKGDKMSDELMGSKDYDPDKNAFVFKESSFLKAIHMGLKTVIDEANGVDPKILMRMHQPLLTKPGETVTVDEDNHRQVVLKRGFHVAATANEVSSNYKDRNRLDPAFRDRFDVVNAEYPDYKNKNPLIDVPVQSLRLAFAAVCNERGVMSQHINPKDLVKFVQLTHITQHLYSKLLDDNLKSALMEKGERLTTSSYVNDRPVMTNCISPRTMINTLRRCADGNKSGLNLHDKMIEIIESLDQGGQTVNKTWAYKALNYLTRLEEENA